MRRRMLMVPVATLVVVALGGVALAAPLSKPDFIKAADDICRQATILRDDAAQENFGDLGPNDTPTAEQLAAYVDDVAPITAQEIDSLRALPAPKDDKKKVKKIWKAVEKGEAKLEADPNILLDGPYPFTKADKLAQKYGFKICGAESTD